MKYPLNSYYKRILDWRRKDSASPIVSKPIPPVSNTHTKDGTPITTNPIDTNVQ